MDFVLSITVNCNEIETALPGDGKTSRLSITIALNTAGLSGRSGKTCNTGNLNGAKQLPAASPQSFYITT